MILSYNKSLFLKFYIIILINIGFKKISLETRIERLVIAIKIPVGLISKLKKVVL